MTEFTKIYVNIGNIEMDFIIYVRKTLPFSKVSVRVKKFYADKLFDISTGSNNSVDICNLVSLLQDYIKYFEDQIPTLPYQLEDGLGIFHVYDGYTIDKFRKKLIDIFSHLGLRIIVTTIYQMLIFFLNVPPRCKFPLLQIML